MPKPPRPDEDSGDEAAAAELVMPILDMPRVSILPSDPTDEEIDQALDFLYAEAGSEDDPQDS